MGGSFIHFISLPSSKTNYVHYELGSVHASTYNITLFPANAAVLTPAVFMHQEIAALVRIKSVIYWSMAYSAHWVGRFWRRVVWQLTD